MAVSYMLICRDLIQLIVTHFDTLLRLWSCKCNLFQLYVEALLLFINF